MSWTLTSAGTTKSFSAWGLCEPNLTLKSWAADVLNFRAGGLAVDAAPVFPIWTALSVTDPNGVCRFVGIVTKIPVVGSGKAEDQNYEVSGPWWYFENLVFQQEWNVAANQTSGQVFGTLVPTLQATTIIGAQSDGTSIDLGQMATIVINYVLSTAAASTPAFVPFQLGTMTPDTIIPFSEVSDLTCAQILKTMFSFVPDATIEFDYTTTPPTLNVSQRGNLPAVSLAAFGGPISYGTVDDSTGDSVEDSTDDPIDDSIGALMVSAGPVSAIELTPRADLVVPAVVLKYKQTNTIDGVAYATVTPDIFPVGAPDPAFRNLVADVDLMPGNASYLKQKLTTTDRPKDYDSIAGTGTLVNDALEWLMGQKRAAWLKGYWIPANWPGNSWPPYAANPTAQDVWVPSVPIGTDESEVFVIRRVVTTLADNYTNAADSTTSPPTPANTLVLPTGNVPAGKGPNTGGDGTNALDYLDQELLTGSVTDWMKADQQIYSAMCDVAVTLEYKGTDPVIAAWFGVAQVPFAFAGQAILTFNCQTMVTNGDTEEYTQLSSLTPPEPIPVGLAQNIYKGRSVLHYQGTIELTEQECSSVVGMGNVLNLTGASGPGAAWATMNAQIFEIQLNLDLGRTRIRVGPPVELDAGQLVANLRALRGRIQSFHLQQQQTGQAGGNNTIPGAGDTAHGGAHTPPGGASAPANVPWSVTLSKRASDGQWQATVNKLSYLMNSPVKNDTSPVDGLGVAFNINPAGDFIYLEQPVANLTPSGDARVTSGQVGGTFDPTKGAWDPGAVAGGGKGWLANDGGSPPSQTFFRVLLGTITSSTTTTPGTGTPSTGQPVYTACCVNNLQIFNVAVNGEAAIMAYPTNSAS